ncbi:hypothetical protein [Nocardia otitidiscaviarum]|uniref:hypothetical protein n=1 Tax=Nocardia otitidiscaviarum TaxID=1823 RepID=UPI0004A6A9DB|nr:hypothetical protein [Nocardia otitidiscaviarum]
MDRLKHVKEFYYSLALDGFGIRRHIGFDSLPDDIKYVHNKVMPALYKAILADDPDYDPQGFHFDGKPGTEAQGTGGVRWFIELLEAHKAFLELSEYHGDLYTRLYRSDGQYSCFLDDLRAALYKDDPEWRGPVQ